MEIGRSRISAVFEFMNLEPSGSAFVGALCGCAWVMEESRRKLSIRGAPRVKGNAGGSGQKERAGVSAECGGNADQCMREKASPKHIDDAAK